MGCLNYNTKFQQLGLEYKNVNTDYSRQLLREKVNRINFNYSLQKSHKEYTTNLCLLNVTPVSYPTLVDMNTDMIDKHVLLGCRFESSMLMYDIHRCHCCGMVRPHHSDNAFPDDAIFNKKNLF